MEEKATMPEIDVMDAIDANIRSHFLSILSVLSPQFL